MIRTTNQTHPKPVRCQPLLPGAKRVIWTTQQTRDILQLIHNLHHTTSLTTAHPMPQLHDNNHNKRNQTRSKKIIKPRAFNLTWSLRAQSKSREMERCPYCHSSHVVKRGKRKKKHETVQLYLYRACQKAFTAQILKGNQALQQFMLANDSVTVAMEVPICLKPHDIYTIVYGIIIR